MKLNPTSGQTSSSIVHSARPLAISASSLAISGCSGACGAYRLGERKKDLLHRPLGDPDLRAQLSECADPPHPPSGQKNEAVTDPLGVRQLMNGEHECAPPGSLAADYLNDDARLPKIEAVKRLVHEQHVVRRQETDSQQQPSIVAL